jgi:RND family efflux transporter MFP subunit
MLRYFFSLEVRMLRKIGWGICLAVAIAGCGKPGSVPESKAVVTVPPLSLGAEDVLTIGQSEYATGPVITGSIQPERRADLRAEISAVVLRVLKENGESVRRGELLVQLDETAIRDNLTSAEESARAATQSLESAERQFQRLKSLQLQGMTSMQALDDAEVRRNNAQSEKVAAATRIVAARQQLQRTEVRAPFDGVVSARKASAGDTAQIGKELIQVIDPASMRFEGLVSADQMPALKSGQRVLFKINGYGPTEFTGRIRRIDATANPISRQVVVLVDFVAGPRPLIVGLYAEGRIDAQTLRALMLPETALIREGDKVSVWALSGDQVKRRVVVLGARDPRLGRFEVASGLVAGERVLRAPGRSVSEGQAYTQSQGATQALKPESVDGTASPKADADGAARSTSNTATRTP